MAKSDAPPSFAEIIQEAQRIPPDVEGLGIDVSSPFPLPVPNDHRVVNLDDEDPAKIPGTPKYAFEAHVKCFYLPKDNLEYETVLNLLLNAHALLRYEDRHFTKEGDCIVVICFCTYKPDPKKDEDDKDEDEDENGPRRH